MQFSFQTLLALAALPVVRLALAQVDPGPSPTASFGCEPHNDHWHCEGANPTVAPIVSTTAVAVITTTTAAASVNPGPSPTASVGCEPHDDHWHCEGPRPVVTSAAPVLTSVAPVVTSVAPISSTHAAGTGDAEPSPTASVGCEPHGDHWHCDGPRTILTSVAPIRTISNNTATATGAATTPAQSLVPTGGAATLGAGIIGGLLGLVGAFAL